MNEYHENIAFIDLKAQLQPIRNDIDNAISRVLDHGQFIMGPEVKEFEKQLVQFTQVKHAVTCANGTDAITLALMALDIQHGEVVFVPSFTYVASAEAVALIGAVPYFVDVDPESFNICPNSLEMAIKEASKCGLVGKAIIAVELFGNPCAYAALGPIASSNGLKIIVDAAQSFGATYAGESTAMQGDIVTTSFFPAKPLGCYGDGGALFTNSDQLHDRLNSLRLHGKGEYKYDNIRVGMNSRLDTVQAAILIEKLRIFPTELSSRRSIAKKYTEALAGRLITPQISVGSSSSWAQYTVKCNQREKFRSELSASGIPTVVYYPLALTQQEGYKHFPKVSGGTLNAEKLSNEVLSLPMHPNLNVKELAKKILNVLENI